MTRHDGMEFLMRKRNYTWLEALEFVHSDWCKCTDEQRRKMLVATIEQPLTLQRFFAQLWFEANHPISFTF